jgi:nucleoid-associated protein YgaU
MRQVTVSGTNLYALAAKYLGDATQWVRIAEQNNLSDPQISGAAVVLLIPAPDPNTTGGAPPQ